jgi:hypothetical protein
MSNLTVSPFRRAPSGSSRFMPSTVTGVFGGIQIVSIRIVSPPITRSSRIVSNTCRLGLGRGSRLEPRSRCWRRRSCWPLCGPPSSWTLALNRNRRRACSCFRRTECPCVLCCDRKRHDRIVVRRGSADARCPSGERYAFDGVHPSGGDMSTGRRGPRDIAGDGQRSTGRRKRRWPAVGKQFVNLDQRVASRCATTRSQR